MFDISFILLGFDYLPSDRLYSVWVCSIKEWNTGDRGRALFAIGSVEGTLCLDVLFIHILSIDS